jgi:NTE family protein
MAYHFKNLVFEGGSVKGIAYVGALEVLEKKGILPAITRVGGTSAGAISALLVGLNFSPKEIRDIFWKLDFKNFLDDDWGAFRDLARVSRQYGWYKGDFFRNWIDAHIKQKVGKNNATFAEIEAQKNKKCFRSIYFVGTNISTGYTKVFSAEDTPDYVVADAVRISMSIPLFFTAIRDKRKDVFVDGGILDNYPIKLFDRDKYVTANFSAETDYYKKANLALQKTKSQTGKFVYNKETLGFRLDSNAEIAAFNNQPGQDQPRRDIKDFFGYISALLPTILDQQQNDYHLHSDDWQRTVYIDTLGVSTFDFSIAEEKKQALANSGKAGAEAYFKWYDNPEPKANK